MSILDPNKKAQKIITVTLFQLMLALIAPAKTAPFPMQFSQLRTARLIALGCTPDAPLDATDIIVAPVGYGH